MQSNPCGDDRRIVPPKVLPHACEYVTPALLGNLLGTRGSTPMRIQRIVVLARNI
jgi:hypothetical protein